MITFRATQNIVQLGSNSLQNDPLGVMLQIIRNQNTNILRKSIKKAQVQQEGQGRIHHQLQVDLAGQSHYVVYAHH